MSANAISTAADIETALSDNLVDDLQSSLETQRDICSIQEKVHMKITYLCNLT